MSKKTLLITTLSAFLLALIFLLGRAGTNAYAHSMQGISSGTKDDPCQPTWSIVSGLPDTGSMYDSLADIAEVSSSDIWAVGSVEDNMGDRNSLAEHWDGTSWSVIPTPSAGSHNEELVAVSAISSADVWAAGDVLNGTAPLLMHWDGSSWTQSGVPYQDNIALSDVEAIATNDVWVVGKYREAPVDRTYIAHWNGAGWTQTTSPNASDSDNVLDTVTAVASNDVWAAGTFFTGNGGAYYTLIEHWNGTAWSIVYSPSVDGAYYNELQALDALSSNDVWAVGYAGSTGDHKGTLAEHWDGTSWTIVPTPATIDYNRVLLGVKAIAPNNVWAVGIDNGPRDGTTPFLHWDGNAWSTVYVPVPPTTSTSPGFSGIDAKGPADIWAAGSAEFKSLVEHYSSPCVPSTTPTATPSVSPTACSLQFQDVPTTDAFYSFARCLACRNIMSGYNCGGAGEPCGASGNPYFRPGIQISRGQIAKIVAQAAGLTDPSGAQVYQDVPPGSPFADYIQRLSTRGYMGGYACNSAPDEPCVAPMNLPYFRPGANATRGQLSKIVTNAAQMTDSVAGQTYQDVPTTAPFYLYIERLSKHNVISGYACGHSGEPCIDPDDKPYFRPNSSVTRGQASKIVANTFLPNCQTTARK